MTILQVCQVSPHTRGWTPAKVLDAPCLDGFPAHAGMDPSSACRPCPRHGFPRTRGDGPWEGLLDVLVLLVSPHTRGWTHLEESRLTPGLGFPAHAGMDPGRRRRDARHQGFPRTRGDGPGNTNVPP